MKSNETSASDVAPPRRRGCGCWTVAFVALLGATTFVVGVYAFWRWSNARGVERMIAIAREKGEPTTPEELAAAYPTSPEIERTTQLWLAAMEQGDLPYRSEEYFDVAILGLGRPGDEASWTAMRRFDDERIMSSDIYEASKAHLAKLGDAIEVAHEARRSGAVARFPLEHEVGEGEYLDTIMPHRHLANVLSLELEVRRHEGRAEGSGKILLTLLALAESLRNHPEQSFQFVRFAEQGVAREQLLVALERGDLSDLELAELQFAWRAVDLVPALRLMLLDLQMEALHSLSSSPHRFLHQDVRPCPEEDAFCAAGFLRRILDRSDDCESAESEAELIAVEVERLMQSPFGERRFAGSRTFFSTAESFPESLQRCQSRNDSTLVLVACERFRREHGDWPESLEELVPGYLDRIPPDRYDGGTLKYRRTDDGVAVYSVGEDKPDDGGVIKANYLEEPSDFGVRLRLGQTRSEVGGSI